MIKIENEPILKIDKENIQKYIGCFPDYVLATREYKITTLKYKYYKLLMFLIHWFVRIRLKIFAPKLSKNDLSNEVIEKIYHREASSYEKKHHLTTNFRDTWWRREVAMDIVSYERDKNLNGKKIELLDIATGVGLSLEEMLLVFGLFNLKVNAIGLDYNQSMLNVANKETLPRIKSKGLLDSGKNLKFVRGDAMSLSGKDVTGLKKFEKNFFDYITVIFGIGGIDKPVKSLKEQLKVLKKGGMVLIIDMHEPIPNLLEKWPFYIGQKSADVFSFLSWVNITKPLVLGSLWGWIDPTPIYYKAKFVTIKDENNKYYGFKVKSFFLNNEFWWFHLPVISTAKIILEKIEISSEEFHKMSNLLKPIE